MYSAPPANNVDLIAIVDAFMISCAHMWDAFKNDSALTSIHKSDVESAVQGHSALKLVRDYANTAKHLKRKSAADVEAAVVEAGSKGAGNFVMIAYGPAGDPSSRSTVDALDLANEAYAAWQAFMAQHGITDVPAITGPLLNPRSPA